MRDSTGNNRILNWAILFALIANVVVFSSFSTVFLSSILSNTSESGEILRIARTSNPVTMDPVDAWDSTSNDMLDQVVETLLSYDLSHPNLPLVGRLAESWYWPDNTTIEFKLRENVFFHDGSRFTADCVLHTITRINYFGNWTGTLDPAVYTMAAPHSLYKFEDGIPIINDTLSFAIDDYNVSLVLNRPYAPVDGLLAYTASSIVHPDSTPADEMLDISEDLVIGTGPFKLVRYIPNSEIRFARWERYWRTGAYWDQIIYVYFPDAITAYNAFCDGNIHWLSGAGGPRRKCQNYIDGLSDYFNGSTYSYIAFNSRVLNRTWRKAIAHAFNYTYLNEEIDEGTTVKANSLVPPGFPAHNYSTTGASYDIPRAREYMQSMGLGYDGPGMTNPWDVGTQVGDDFTPGLDESDWTGALFTPPVGNFTAGQLNFRHRSASHFMGLLTQRFTEDMDLIGIGVYLEDLTWDQFIHIGQHQPERLHLYYVGWGPDYFETFNMIDPLVNNASDSNFAQINDPYLQSLLEQTAAETNTAARHLLYKRLQGYIIDVQSYHMPLQYDKLYFVHAESLKGFPYNCMRYLYWYPTYRE